MARFVAFLIAFGVAAYAASAVPARFSCQVVGAKATKWGVSRDLACARFSSAFEKAIRTRFQITKGKLVGSSAHWISADLDLSQPNRISALMKEGRGRATKTHPIIGITVMDRALRIQDVDKLADAAALELHKR